MHARLEYLLRVPSNYAWMVLRRKYDAFTTDRAYDTHPASWLGPLGWWADRRVLNYAVHVALRERLDFVVQALVDEITRRQDGDTTVRVLSAPCGLCRDILRAADELRTRRPSALERLELDAFDLDAAGDVLREARRRSQAAEILVVFGRENLLDPSLLRSGAADGRRYDVINCIGLAAWLSLDEVEWLARFFHNTVMTPGATLLIDNFAWHEHSALGEELEINTRYHPPAEFRGALERAGFRIVTERTTTNGVTTLTIAQAI
jgi:hypothetical protein